MKLPYRILVLDDDEHALSGIVELLRDAGHHVTGAATYDAAKRLLQVSPFDLLVSDVRVRSFNGLHLVMQTRADHPETAIIITRYDDRDRLEADRYRSRRLVGSPSAPPVSATSGRGASRCAAAGDGRANASRRLQADAQGRPAAVGTCPTVDAALSSLWTSSFPRRRRGIAGRTHIESSRLVVSLVETPARSARKLRRAKPPSADVARHRGSFERLTR